MGLQWTSASYSGQAAFSSGFVEIKIPFADIDFVPPSQLLVHLSMINEQDAVEWTWAAAPSTSFTDGYDPDYIRYFNFRPGVSAAPDYFPVW